MVEDSLVSASDLVLPCYSCFSLGVTAGPSSVGWDRALPPTSQPTCVLEWAKGRTGVIPPFYNEETEAPS